MTHSATDRRGSYQFGPFRLAADASLLVRDGVPVPLPPKVLQTLRVLVDRAGEVVSKTDLLEAVWPDSFVEESGLSRNISLLRQALGCDTRTYVVTASRIGYRFAAPVVRLGPATDIVPDRLLVLPFRQLRDDAETKFLAFAVPDAVVSALSGLRSLVVRSSVLASRFIGEPPDLTRVASDADVNTLLIGTFLREGSFVRMNAQLLSVPSGTVRWSQSFDAPVGDVFALQDGLVAHIVAALSLTLTEAERRRLARDAPSTPRAYELFLRGNEAIGPQGIASASNLKVARGLYLEAVKEDPQFGPAWARLGRCHYLVGKVEHVEAPEGRVDGRARCLDLAEACFRRALEVSPDLPLAHAMYALVEIDMGRARDAMVRLIGQALAGTVHAELFAALVQACRYCGLLEPSVAAHYRARALELSMPTSGYQSLWHLGDDDGALREGIRPYLLMAIITGMRGDRDRALRLLRELETKDPTPLLRRLIGSLCGVLEDRRDLALANAIPVFKSSDDPEAWYFVARTIAYFGDTRALDELRRALDGGYVLYRALLRHDPWLDPVRTMPEFGLLVSHARAAYLDCRAAYLDAGGEHLLGPAPNASQIEARACSA